MVKRLQKEIELFKAKERVKLTFGVLVCTVLSTCLLIVAAFTIIPISHYYIPLKGFLHPVNFWSTSHDITEFIANIQYVPQVPMIAAMSVILGKRFSCTAIFLYLITGLFFIPVFSLGGGFRYVFQYGFGYILGFFPMVLILSKYLQYDYKPKKVFAASIYSVLALHICGMVYLIMLCSIKHEAFSYVQDLLHMMTGVKFFYDLIFTFFSVYIANAVRKILWLSMD